MNGAAIVAEVDAHMKARGCLVLAKPTDTPPANRGWCIIYGPNPYDDPMERAVCGDYILTHGEVTIMCAGHNRAEAQYVMDQAALLKGARLDGSDPIRRLPSRDLAPESDTDAHWSAPVVYELTGP